MSLNTQSTRSFCCRAAAVLALAASLTLASTGVRADTGTCGGQSLTLPFTDVAGSNIFFCSIAQAFFTGLTNGTTPTTYSPGANVTRDQMAAFITRTQDSALKRGSRRAAAGQWWTPKDVGFLNTTAVGGEPHYSCFDGEDIWVPNKASGTVSRVHASDGRVLGTWTGADDAHNTIAAAGFIYVLGRNPGGIYRINPTLAPTAATLVANTGGLSNSPRSITCDGLNLWTANSSAAAGSITRYNIVTGTTTTFSSGFGIPVGIVFDGTHLWVVDAGTEELHRVNPANGMILETLDMVDISAGAIPVFDGSNIWVPVSFHIKVVSTSTPARVLATLSGNGLDGTNLAAAFDGERILVINPTGNGALSLWKASSLTPLGFLDLEGEVDPTGGVCSDGLHFWISVITTGTDFVMRF